MPINSSTRRLSEIAAYLLSARIRREHRIKIFLGLYRHQPLIRPARWNVRSDNQDGCRIASSRNAPERVEHCLTRMLPTPRQFVNRPTRSCAA